MKLLLTGALLTLAIAGCSAGRASTGDPKPQATRVVVENNNWLDVNVYAIRNGMRQRLGTVTTNATRTFDLPETLVAATASVSLLIDLIGTRQTRLMPAVNVMRGDRINLDVFNHLALSSVSVFSRRGWR